MGVVGEVEGTGEEGACGGGEPGEEGRVAEPLGMGVPGEGS